MKDLMAMSHFTNGRFKIIAYSHITKMIYEVDGKNRVKII